MLPKTSNFVNGNVNAARAIETVIPAEITIEHLANGTTPPSHVAES